MKVLRLETGRSLAPWFDPIGDTPVLDASLRQSQEQAIAAAGCTLVDVAPTDEPYILLGDRLWFTAEALRRVVRGGPGRLAQGLPLKLTGNLGAVNVPKIGKGARIVSKRPALAAMPSLTDSLGSDSAEVKSSVSESGGWAGASEPV